MKSIRAISIVVTLINVFAGGFTAFGAVTNVSSVGILDPNPNNLTIVDAVSNTAGGATLANLQTMITSAFANNRGGVFDFQELYQGGTWPNNNSGANNGTTVGNGAANSIVGTYGTSQSKSISFYRLEGDVLPPGSTALVGQDGIDANTNQGTNVISGGWDTQNGSGTGLVDFAGNTAVIDGTGSTAGGGYMGIVGDGTPCTLVFSNNPLSAFGITGLPRGATRDTNIVFTLSDSTTFTTSDEVVGTSAVFFGYQAPTGKSITQVQINNPNGVNRFDDLAFVVALKPGDFNLDGHVDSSDISAMENALTNLSGYQSSHGLSAADFLTVADVNHDGKVTNADLQSLLLNLKSGLGSTSSVPEPATWLLLTIGSAALLQGRRLKIA